MATVIASEAASRAGIKNKLGLRRSERQIRVVRCLCDAAGTVMTGDTH
jgi:hypothetical protein